MFFSRISTDVLRLPKLIGEEIVYYRDVAIVVRCSGNRSDRDALRNDESEWDEGIVH